MLKPLWGVRCTRYLAAAAGVAVTAAAIFGSVYNVHPPTSYAAHAAIATFVVGLVLAS